MFTIEFEGKALPQSMSCVDLATLYDYLPDVPTETKEWLWQFTICLDRERTCESKEVIHHFALLKSQIVEHSSLLIANLMKSGIEEQKVNIYIQEWENGINEVLLLSAQTINSRWIGKAITEQGAAANP